MRYRILAIIILSLVIYFLYHAATDEEVGFLRSTEIIGGQEFDYYMNDVENTSFSPDGILLHILAAERLTHFPDPEYSLLDLPHFIIYREGDEEPWHVWAEHAHIDTDPTLAEQRVELMNDVHIQRLDAQGREMNIYTDFLTIYPESRKAATDEDIRMVTAENEISGTGMRADLDTNHIQLLANVRGYYDSPTSTD